MNDSPTQAPQAREASPTAAATPLTVFMLVKTRVAWLELAAAEQTLLLREQIEPILHRYADEVRLRVYDTEFYSSIVTDVWVWDATSHRAYENVVEALRSTPFWDFYFEIVEILPGVENSYSRDHRQAPLAA
jgi:hypothetical protein